MIKKAAMRDRIPPTLTYETPSLAQALLASSRQALVALNHDGIVLEANSLFLDWTGCHPPQAVVHLEDWLGQSRLDGTTQQALIDYLQPRRGNHALDFPAAHQLFPGRTVAACQRAFLTADGHRGVLGVFYEVTIPSLAWASHEIRNPLNAILGFTDLLSTLKPGRNLDSEVLQSTLRGLTAGTKHLKSLLEILLDNAQPDCQATPIRQDWMPVKDLIGDLVAIYRPLAEKQGLQLFSQLPPGPERELWIDKTSLTQILINLIQNALRFTAQGSIHLGVQAVAGTVSGWEFFVEDTGRGVRPEDQERIFAPFCQAHGQDRQRLGGNGLGLTICRSLAQRLGATLSLSPSSSGGSRFSLHFADLKMRVQPSSVASPILTRPEAPTLLIADDEATNRLLIRGFLRGTTIQLIEAEDGQQAVELWQEHRPDAALIDLKMPIQDGHQAAREIRKLAEGPERWLLAMSAEAPRRPASRQDRLWDGYLEKPFSRIMLLNFLSNFLTFVDESGS